MTDWTTFLRRTEDPKLAFVESLLKREGIPSRRNGFSFHAPILEVPVEFADRAWALLDQDVLGDGRTLDDIPDDDSVFTKAD